MKYIKTMLFVLALTMTLSCSQDNLESQPTTTSETTTDFRTPLGMYDTSNLGVYKGIFTTLDGMTQGEVIISLSPNKSGIAEVILSSGDVIRLESQVLKGQTIEVNHLTFNSVEGSSKKMALNFSVNNNGTEPMVTEVDFDRVNASIQIAKHTQRTPINPILGTYTCTNCVQFYPQYSDTAHTFNLMYVGPLSNLTVTTSIVYNEREYVSTNNTIGNCSIVGTNADCVVAGSSMVRGLPLNYSGLFQFRTTNTPCSYVTGAWSMDIGYVVLEGTFISTRTTPCP